MTRLGLLLAIGLGLAASLPAGGAPAREAEQPKPAASVSPRKPAPAAPAASRQPYEGSWAPSPKACRDHEGVAHMGIAGNGFSWYETRCRAHAIKAAGARSWTMRMSCEGEGDRFSARPRLSLATPDRLIMEAGPVGPTKRLVYVRCGGGRGR